MDGFPNFDAAKARAAGAAIKIVAGQLSETATLGEKAIIAAELPVYQRGHALVRPAIQEVTAARGRMTSSACFLKVTCPLMVDFLSRAASWTRYDARLKSDVAVDPPERLANILLSRAAEWTFPIVTGIITTPTLRPDLSILSEPGYDLATRLYLALDPSLSLPPIPGCPGRAAAEEALRLLDELLVGFPFVSDVDRSVALSALLTTICRGAMSVAPLHAFHASTAGSGKSFLADLASAIATGRPCPVTAASGGTEELDKKLGGMLLEGVPIVCLDNINGELGSDLLCQAVERPLVKVRKLGGSDTYEIETKVTLFATGNGLRVRGDMTRRTLLCGLDAQMERPELRTFDFDPVERVLAARGRYVAAALTVVRGFVTSGATPSMTPLASYSEYSATVRGALIWLGRPDPVRSMEQAREDDPELGELREVMIQWWKAIGPNIAVAAKALVRKADRRLQDDDTGRQTNEYENPELRDALLAVAPGRSGTIDTAQFGKWLRSKKGRVVTITPQGRDQQRVRFETAGVSNGSALWKLSVLPRP